MKLDTTNVEWLLETGMAMLDYVPDFDKSMNYFNIAFRQSVLQYGEISRTTSIAYNDIGGAYNDFGNYEKALECFIKSAEIKKEIFGADNVEIANTYSNIGGVYKVMGDFDLGLKYYELAKDIYEKHFGSDNQKVGTMYNNIGTVYYYKHDYRTAIDYYKKKFEYFRKGLQL